MRIVSLVATAAASLIVASAASAQPATFVYRLGHDTLAIEQYSRVGNRMIGEMVQRSGGAVVRTQYEITTGSNNRPVSATIRRLQANGTPMSPSEIRFRMSADSVVREYQWPDSVQRRAFAMRGGMVNFPTFIYGPTELLAALRRSGTSVDSLPAVGTAGNAGMIGIVPAGGDTMRLRGGSYPMQLLFDANGRLQLVDGRYTTNKVVATRESRAIDIAALARTMKPSGALSGREVARATYGAGGIVLVDYGRPMVRDRSVWGGTLVPYDSVWRFGANDATHLVTTRTLNIGDLSLAPGMYTLFLQHTRNGTFLIVNRQTGQWGTQYTPAQDVGRVAVSLTPAPGFVEEFTISLRSEGAARGALEFAWGDQKATVPFTVSTR